LRSLTVPTTTANSSRMMKVKAAETAASLNRIGSRRRVRWNTPGTFTRL
jgi:hypothetical protein